MESGRELNLQLDSGVLDLWNRKTSMDLPEQMLRFTSMVFKERRHLEAISHLASKNKSTCMWQNV